MRALASAPSIANVLSASLDVIELETPDSIRTPNIFPPRSTITIMASCEAETAEARFNRVSTSSALKVSFARFVESDPSYVFESFMSVGAGFMICPLASPKAFSRFEA